jgi:aromatic ring-cleaving dioxygenase
MVDIVELFPAMMVSAAVLLSIICFQLALLVYRKAKPMEADAKQHQEELKERRKRLEPFIALRIPLYYDDELLDTIYSQYQLKRSSMEIDTITRKIASDSSQRLDVKIASVEGRQTESEEQTLKEIKNREMKYKRTLEWMCDNRQVMMGLEEPVVSTEKARQLEEQLRDIALEIPAKDRKIMLAEIVAEIVGWLEKDRLGEGVALNKFLLVKGNFLVNERSLKQIHLVLKNNIEFHVYCNVENCTSTGKGTFTQGSSVPVGVFGYIKEMSKKEPMLAINPVSISSISLDSEKGKNVQGV